MGQQPRHPVETMNSNSNARSPGYHQKAMEEIQNALRPFAKSGGDMGSSAASTISITSATSGVSSLGSAASSTGSNINDKDLLLIRQLINMGYSEVSNLVRLLIIKGCKNFFL